MPFVATPRHNRQAFSFLLCVALVFLALPAGAQQTARNQALQATLQPDGRYRLTFLATGWTLDGSLPGKVTAPRASTGKDAIGPYRQLSATFNGGTRQAEIRVYTTRPIALFRHVWKTAGPNTTPFPTFQSLPTSAMRFSYRQENFAFYQFGKLGPQGPWSLFDQHNHVLLLSPADHFQVSTMNELPNGEADSRIRPSIAALPAGFSHGTLITAGSGMNRVFDDWGSALLALGNKPRPANDADLTLSTLGYWTDNLTTYYYKFDPALGYTGTLLAVRDQFKKLGIPLGYMQLDSWFYPKGPQGRWNSGGSTLPFGEYVYRADKQLFPQGLAAFHQALGLPLVTHARWISPTSPYHAEYKMSGNVVIDPKFWNATAAYLHHAGVITYEQDWLNHNARTAMNLTDPPAFLGEMNRSMATAGLTLQYCMPLPADYMASTLYPAVQTIRTSADGFERARWDTFLYDSRLAAAVGLWPWTDAFFSNDLGSLIVSTLSAGPVGVGDAISQINASHLLAAVRADGALLKPDTPLLPIDDLYASDAANRHAPMVAVATTRFGALQADYVFAYPRQSSDTQLTVPLASLQISGQVFAYDWVAHRGQLIPQNGSLHMEFTNGWAYSVLSSVSRNGIALLGDTTKIVPLSRKRISVLRQQNGNLTAQIQFAPNEKSLTLTGYATHRPTVTAISGKTKTLRYDNQTHMFTAQVFANKSREAQIQIH